MITATFGGCDIIDPPIHVARALRDSLTVAPIATAHVPRPFRFPVYTEYAPNRFLVPVQWAKDFFSKERIVDARPPGKIILASFRGDLRDSQKTPVEATLSMLRQRGGAVLSLPTGGGKTACALYIATQLRQKTLIVVHKKILADQWASRIRQFVPGASITALQGSKCDMSGDFVIAMVQTLISRQYPRETFHGIGLLVFDEAHHVGAPAFCKCMNFLQCPMTLGLTATPERKDGLQKLLHFSLGPMAYQETMRQRHDVTVERKTYKSVAYKEPQPTNRRGTVDTAAVLTCITEDPARNEFLINLICEIPPERHVLVLSHRRAHCEALVLSLKEKGIDVGLCIGNHKDFDHRIIVATYALVSEGFDEPRLDTLVLATPASDVTQAVGRVLRTSGNPGNSPVVIDIVDAWGSCYAQSLKRKAFYGTSGFNV